MYEKFLRAFLVISGSLAVGIGVVGIFVPLLPTTPFLLLAAACYVKSSPSLYKWLITNRYFGNYIRNYREGKGIPVKIKTCTIVILWVTICISAIFVDHLHARIFLLLVAVGVTLHMLAIKTLKPFE